MLFRSPPFSCETSDVIVEQWTQSENVGDDDETAGGASNSVDFGWRSGGKGDPHEAILPPGTSSSISNRVAVAHTSTATMNRTNMR